MEEILKFNEIVQSVYASTMLPIPRNCNGYVVVNVGTALFWVNGFPLKPLPPGHPEVDGASRGVPGNRNEIFVGDNGVIKVVRDTLVGTNPELIFIFKCYIC